jgi:hypothetical protein
VQLGLLAAAAIFANSASADESYVLSVNGKGVHALDAYECPGTICPLDQQVVSFDWGGLLTVVVNSDAAGTFTGSQVVSLAFERSMGLVSSFSSQSLFGFSGPPSVTVSDGEVTSIDAYLPYSPYQKVTFSGLSVQYFEPSQHHYGSTTATAVLAPVPEPSTWLLLICGLAAIATTSRRHRA